ncbi:VOC family protein [Alteromonas sp. C1M14]|uniref:VOC family protein n=1 Tax=Alteromonas sp. C1M14 TaxID=2841567 RepID=UPI001C07F05D|nr:VOC family protein [Alteromonas sp. C1M14]MBU2978904.1 VOC family protein [Alteromonas sp. C1M14]
MSDPNDGWRDLTVDDAIAISDFYQHVLGWTKVDVAMDGYSDFIMKDSKGNVMGGICHRKGANNDVPTGWTPYFTTADFNHALETAIAQGGEAITEVRHHGAARFVYIKDPSRATFALYSEQK